MRLGYAMRPGLAGGGRNATERGAAAWRGPPTGWLPREPAAARLAIAKAASPTSAASRARRRFTVLLPPPKSY